MGKRGKYGELIKNVGLLAIGNFATKMLGFFLVPLYTSVLTKTEYGIHDFFNTSINLLVPLLTIDIQESVLRFSLEKDSDKKDIFSIGLRYVFSSCIFVIILTIGNFFLGISESFSQYALEFILLYSFHAFATLFLYFGRGIDRVLDISISGVLSSAVMITCNILFLAVLNFGLRGYFWASILGFFVQCMYLLFRAKIWQYYTPAINPQLKKEMVTYSKPMVLNAISWWVNNASDRYVVIFMRGMADNGVYSASYKIPSIITTLQGIFGQAWTMSAVKDYDPEDKNGFFINVYNMMNFFLVFSCSGLLMMNKIATKILCKGPFFESWKYVPFLLISTVFSGMSTYLGGILSAMKKSSFFAQTSVVTAIINTGLNFILIWKIGVQGAAVATAFSYFVMWILRLRLIKQYINLRVSILRDCTMYAIICFQAIFVIIDPSEALFRPYQIVFVLMVLLVYRKEAIEFYNQKIAKKKSKS